MLRTLIIPLKIKMLKNDEYLLFKKWICLDKNKTCIYSTSFAKKSFIENSPEHEGKRVTIKSERRLSRIIIDLAYADN